MQDCSQTGTSFSLSPNCTLANLNGVKENKVGKKGQLIITEVVVSREGDLLVDHVQPVVGGETVVGAVTLKQILRIQTRNRRWKIM